jgi:simple sugar transport system ATP-binding protein
VRSLAAGEKQKVEILKQLYLKSRIVILDEPTSVLTPSEADEVLGLLHEMARAGDVSLIIITHKFREVTQFADEVTVLRRGKRVGGGAVKDLTPAAMAEMMVGSAPRSESARPSSTPAGDVRLRAANLEADDDLGLPALRDVTFEVRSGEIVGIAAVVATARELVGCSPDSALRTGASWFDVDYRTRGPSTMGSLPSQGAPATLGAGDERGGQHGVPLVRPSPLRSPRSALQKAVMSARKSSSRLRRRTPSADAHIGNLSRNATFVLARELGGRGSARGRQSPMGSTRAVAGSRTTGKAREQGTAVLLVSADLDEIFARRSRARHERRTHRPRNDARRRHADGRPVHGRQSGSPEGALPTALLRKALEHSQP